MPIIKFFLTQSFKQPIVRGFVFGKGGIRTLGSREATPVFKTEAINRSATFPLFYYYNKNIKINKIDLHLSSIKHVNTRLTGLEPATSTVTR
jgi:hypothetical protein